MEIGVDVVRYEIRSEFGICSGATCQNMFKRLEFLQKDFHTLGSLPSHNTDYNAGIYFMKRIKSGWYEDDIFIVTQAILL